MTDKSDSITFILNSLQGTNRGRNQDDILILSDKYFYLFVLFDGVSSLSESWNFIQSCKLFIKENHNQYLYGKRANLRELIYQMHLDSLDSDTYGKTTCSALLLKNNDNVAYVVSIGDTRIYSFTNTYLEVLTTDDNLPGNSNLLTKYIGLEGLSRDDIEQIEVNANQNFLICTDGFYPLMERNLKKYFDIFHFKRKGNIKNAINRLQKNRNSDDSTYIIIKNGRI